MSKPATHFIVTANYTDDGAVAYRRADGTWSRKLSESGLFPDEETAKPVAASVNKNEQREISDPYVIDVHVGASGIEATTAREHIRANGPTIPMRRPDAGLHRRPA